jgi:hypothetical protein
MNGILHRTLVLVSLVQGKFVQRRSMMLVVGLIAAISPISCLAPAVMVLGTLDLCAFLRKCNEAVVTSWLSVLKSSQKSQEEDPLLGGNGHGTPHSLM